MSLWALLAKLRVSGWHFETTYDTVVDFIIIL